MLTVSVSAIKCPRCKHIIYSRVRHDFRTCPCRSISIDGGFDYNRIVWIKVKKPVIFPLKINATKKQLYDDWINKTDKFGLIEEKK